MLTAACVSVLAACTGPAGRSGTTGPGNPESSAAREGAASVAPGVGPLVAGLQEGEWTFHHPNGTLESRGGYEDDEREGTWTHWHDNGALRMRGTYRNGRQVGLWEFWHPNGQLHCRGEYVDGREHGEWSFWTPSGAPQQRGFFDAGRRALEWTEWDGEGRVSARGWYVDDTPVGIWRLSDGGAERSVTYITPAAVSLVDEAWPDGTKRRQGLLLDGLATGTWATFHGCGALRATVHFVAGEPCGELVCMRDDGSLLARGPLRDGAPAGEWTVRVDDELVERELPRTPRAPWDRRWSDAASAESAPPLAVVDRWLHELCAPREAVVVAPSPPADEGAASSAPTARLEAPTDPGRWTVRERAELELLRRYYRDGWLPRRQSIGARYGGAPNAPRLGEGDASLGARVVGERLPCTRFPCADGTELDLESLRGRRVLLVVLRGFTSQVCVYCFAQTAELAPLAGEFAAADCEVVVLYPGTRGRLAAFNEACREEFGDTPPPYRMVYDPELTLARALGLQGDLARPASFVLDRTGVVRRAYVAESSTNVADRPAAQDLLRWVRAAD
jgi:antitoxin component YwqK of YwqJK toxin-antitoxin module/peroxiredoxin